MNDEYTPRNPAPQEPQDAQPQQAAQSAAPQSIGSPVAVLAPAPANVTSDNLILTANGYKPLIPISLIGYRNLCGPVYRSEIHVISGL